MNEQYGALDKIPVGCKTTCPSHQTLYNQSKQYPNTKHAIDIPECIRAEGTCTCNILWENNQAWICKTAERL